MENNETIEEFTVPEILENVLADPAKYAEDEMLYDHIYAVMLLGHFKAVQYGRGSL